MRTRRSGLLVVTLLLVTLVPGVVEAAPDELEARLDRAQDRLAELDEQVSLAVEEYNEAAAQLERLAGQRQETAEVVETLASQVAELEDATAAFVRSLYIRGPATELGTALEADEVVEAGRSLALMDRVARHRQAQLEQLAARRVELDAARQRLGEQLAAATAREAELADRRAAVEQLIAGQRDEIDDLQDRIAEAEAREAARRAAEERARAAAARERAAAEAAAAEAAEEATPQEAATDPASEPPPAPVPAPEAPAPPAPEPAPPGTRAGADTAVQAALSQVGKPYQWGGSGPDSYDCSGLTSWAWAHAGVSLPHSSRMQYAATTRVSRDQLQPGDLIFYNSPISHVAMYIGGTRVVEAPYSGAHVRVREDGLLRNDIVGYGRP